MGAFNQLNGAIFDAAAIEARISAVDGKSIYNQRDGGILDFDSLARRLTALDGKVAVGQGGIEFDVDTFMRRLAAIEAVAVSPADAWAAAVTANGGTYDANTLTAMRTFVASLQSSGVWSKINRINLFAGADLPAALVPLKVGGGSATETNTNFVGGDYALTTGLTGNGSSKVLNTGLSILSLTKSDFGMGTWTRTNTVEAARRADIGSSYTATGVTDRLYNHTQFSSGSGDVGVGNITGAGWPGSPTGLLSTETTGTTTVKTYTNGVLGINTALWNNDGFQAGTITVFNGGGSFFSTHALSGYYIGNNLDQAALTTAWSAFNTAVGR